MCSPRLFFAVVSASVADIIKAAQVPTEFPVRPGEINAPKTFVAGGERGRMPSPHPCHSQHDCFLCH